MNAPHHTDNTLRLPARPRDQAPALPAPGGQPSLLPLAPEVERTPRRPDMQVECLAGG